MPLYTYLCDKCFQKEVHLRSDKLSNLPIPCEICGNGNQHRIFDASGTSFSLKGDGWFNPSKQSNNKE